MARRGLILTAAALLAAGCVAEEPAEAPRNMSGAEVANELAELRIAPGEWESTTEIVSVEAPSLPREMERMMRERRNSVRYCLTPDQVADPADLSRRIAAQGSGCEVQDFRMDGGRVEGQMVCGRGTPRETRSVMRGEFSAERFVHESRVITAAPAFGGEMRIETRVTGRRLGPCPAGEGGQE